MVEKKDVAKYLIIGLVFAGLIGILVVLQAGPTGFAVYTDNGDGTTTLMLQIADVDNLEDAYVGSSGDADKNFGTAVLLETGINSRAYINFNLSGVPDNQNIDNASLCLYVLNTKKTQLINIHHVYDDFDESTLTWNNQPCGTDFNNHINCNLTEESSFQMNSDFQNTWICWDVKEMIGKDYNFGNENISIILYTSDSDINSFNSKEVTDSSLRPYLNITYSTANVAPTINLVLPQEGASYGYNESLALDFSVLDTDDNLDSCWYNIDDGANITLASCTNTTFDIAEGSHTLNIYANDSLGLSVSDSALFSVAVGAPSIILNSPIDIYFNSGDNIEFDYIPTDVDLDSCWLLGDFTGVYTINQTDTSVISGSVNTFTIISLDDNTYLWNVGCNDSVGNSAINGNKTFYVDTINPDLSLSEPIGSKTSRTGIALIFLVSDVSPTSCYYNITTSVVENFFFYLWTIDSAGNLNSANSSFSVDTSSAPIVPPSNGGSSGGGGGGGGGSPAITANKTGKMEVSLIKGIIAHQGDEKSFILNVKNTGKVFLNKCRLIASGDITSWTYSSQVEGIAPGQNIDFEFNLNIPEEIESKDYSGGLEIKCNEGSNNQEISVSIPKGLVEIKGVVNEKDGLSISYVFDNSKIIGEEVVMEIWLVDERGIEIQRVRDIFLINKDGLIERNIKMELSGNLVGIYNIYFALGSNLDDFVKQSVVLGKSSTTTGFAVFDTSGGEKIAYIIFVVIILFGILFIWKRHKKEGLYTPKASKGWFLEKKK